MQELMRGYGGQRGATTGNRLASSFVLVVMAAGCLLLWAGVPVGAMWLASMLTSSFGAHMPLALALAIPGMLAVALGLAWLNELYLRITGGEVRDAGGMPRRRRGPLEPMLAVCFAIAVATMLFWFFTIAENPALEVW